MTTKSIAIFQDSQDPPIQLQPKSCDFNPVYKWILTLPLPQEPLETTLHLENTADSYALRQQDDSSAIPRRARYQNGSSPSKRRKLAHLNSNIMQQGAQRQRSPRKASDTLLSSAAQARPTTPDNDYRPVRDEDPESTPKSAASAPLSQVPPPRNSIFSPPPPSSEISASTTSAKPGRSSSPHKKLRNSELSENPVRWTLFDLHASPIPGDVDGLLSDIRDIIDGEGVVPYSISLLLLKTPHYRGSGIRPRHIEKQGANPDSDSSDADLLRLVIKLMMKTLDCTEEGLSEASWNDEVHSRLLDLGLNQWLSQGLRYRNATSAKIDNAKNIGSGESRMVDYCITFGSQLEAAVRIRDFLRSKSLQSINHTSAPGLGFTPIAVSIETKRARVEEDDARHQLGTWVTAHFAYLRRLSGPDIDLPSLLLIMVQGPDWRLCIASAGKGKSNPGIIFRDLLIGDTGTILGIFTLLKALDRIARHIVEVNIPWFETHVLGSKSASTNV